MIVVCCQPIVILWNVFISLDKPEYLNRLQSPKNTGLFPEVKEIVKTTKMLSTHHNVIPVYTSSLNLAKISLKHRARIVFEDRFLRFKLFVRSASILVHVL